MDIIYFFETSPLLFITTVGFIALLIGSFLNVVISRLPLSLKQDWRKDCYEYLDLRIPASEQENLAVRINILLPRSFCPKCKTTLRALDNIPLLSYIFLRGKCHFCKTDISIKYPVVEALTSILCMIVAWHFGVSIQMLAGCVLVCSLVAQSGIDLEQKMIPDEITLPVLWAGLIFNIFDVFTNSHSAILGAVCGYLSLWLVYWIFFLATKKIGMGYGDFKLLAMLGAWLGWQALPFIIIFSSILGSVVGLVFLLVTTKNRNTQIPFGPFLAAAGFVALLWGPHINAWYLNYVGI